MREGLFTRLARAEKEIAAEEEREPEGWMWTEGMDVPRHIDFDAISDVPASVAIHCSGVLTAARYVLELDAWYCIECGGRVKVVW